MALRSVKVVGRLGIIQNDMSDADDEPDVVYCDTGTVTLTSLAPETRYLGDTPMASLLGQAVITGIVGPQGYITWNGLPYVKIPDLSSEELNPNIPVGATHEVAFVNCRVGGTGEGSRPVNFTTRKIRLAQDTVDEATGECNLVKQMPVPSLGGVPIVQGPPGEGIAELVQPSPGKMALMLTSGETTNEIDLPVGPGGTDTGVATYIATPGTSTRSAINSLGFARATVIDPLVAFRASLTDEHAATLADVRAALNRSVTEPVSIVAAGDSFTYGSNAAPGLGWVERLTTYLAATYQTRPYVRHGVVNPSTTSGPPTTPGAHVYNAGSGGATSHNYLTTASIAKIVALKPALIIHAPGVNDWRVGDPPAHLATRVKQKIDEIEATATAPVTHLLIHWFEHSSTHGPAAWHEYGTVLESLAATYDNVVYVDLAGPFYALGVPGADPLDLVDADLLHPTTAGHDLMARMVFEVLVHRPATGATGAPEEPSGPTIYAADTFAGDGALTATEVGAKAYVQAATPGGTWSRVSGRMAVNKLGVATAPIIAADTGHANGVVSLTLVTAANDGILFRLTDPANFWIVAVNGGVYKLYKSVAGAFATVATSTVVPAANDVLAVTLNGSSIAVSVNGTPVPAFSVTDAFNASATRHGAWAGGSTARTGLFDNFSHTSS